MQRYRCTSSTIMYLAVLFLLGAAQAVAAKGDPPSRVARLAEIAGDVSLEPAGTNQWTQAADNTPLTTGDRLYVDRNGRAELQMGQLGARAWQYTYLVLVDLTGNTMQLGLSQGSLHIRTFALNSGSKVEIDTPNGAITVLQPGDVRLDAYTSDGGTLVTVDSGEVEVSGRGVSRFLGAGESAHLIGSNPTTLISQRMPGKDPFDVWSGGLDRKFLGSQARLYVNPNTIGFDDLDKNGTWVQTPGYGPVWYPAGVPAEWVPYSTGRWAWIEPWGWTWVGADRWGFAPFHYGRWVHTRSRWGWVPGPVRAAPIYSPAMVGFVGGAGISTGGRVPLAAWYPLGPGEPFYPGYFCSPDYFTQVNLTNIRSAGVLPKNVNAANYYRYYHSRLILDRLRYVHRRAGTIAIPADEFAAGHVITPATAVHLSPQQWLHARMLPHPLVAPTLQSVVPRPVSSVSVPAERPVVSRAQATAAAGAQAAASGSSDSEHYF